MYGSGIRKSPNDVPIVIGVNDKFAPITKKKKGIFVIFECDSHESIDSYSIKGIFTNEKKAKSTFGSASVKFIKNNPENWFLKLGLIEDLNTISLDRNMLRDIEVIDEIQHF